MPENITGCQEIRYDRVDEDLARVTELLKNMDFSQLPSFRGVTSQPLMNYTWNSGPFTEFGLFGIVYRPGDEVKPFVPFCGHLQTPSGGDIYVFSFVFPGADGQMHVIHFGKSEEAGMRAVERSTGSHYLTYEELWPGLQGEDPR